MRCSSRAPRATSAVVTTRLLRRRPGGAGALSLRIRPPAAHGPGGARRPDGAADAGARGGGHGRRRACAAHRDGGGALHRRNERGTHALLAVAERARVGRVVHLSTVAVYGRKGDRQVVGPADGYDPFPELRCVYAWSNIGAEPGSSCIAMAAHAVVLRPGIVYGGRATSSPGSPGGPSARCFSSSARRECCCRWCTAPRRRGRRACAAQPRRARRSAHLVGTRDADAGRYLAHWSAARGERLEPVYVRRALLRRIVGLPSPRLHAPRLRPRLGDAVAALRNRATCAGARLVPEHRACAGFPPSAGPGSSRQPPLRAAFLRPRPWYSHEERHGARTPRSDAPAANQRPAAVPPALHRRGGDRGRGRHAALGLADHGAEDTGLRGSLRRAHRRAERGRGELRHRRLCTWRSTRSASARATRSWCRR